MQASKYERATDFTEQSSDETDHVALNKEFDGIAQSVNGLRDNLALIQQDDGKLAASIVTADNLAPAFLQDLTDEIAGNVAGIADEVVQQAQVATLAATSAKQSEVSAATSATSALASRNASALNAQSASESANAAYASKNAAEDAKAAAQVGAGTATTKAAEAVVSANAAASSKDASALSATTASNKATQAVTSEANAGVSKDAAAASAVVASTKAGEAAASAALINTENFTPQRGGSHGASIIPSGPAAARPPAVEGEAQIRYNDEGQTFEGRKGLSDWGSIGGGASGPPGNPVFYLNDRVLLEDYTIPADKGAHTVGKLTVALNKKLTVGLGARLVIL